MANFPLLVFLVTWLVQPPVLAADPLSAGPLPSLPGVSLVEGPQAPFLQRQPIAAVCVYAFHEKTPVPIPFQIDERDHNERWVLDQGTAEDHRSSSGEFADNHVLVIMNRDLGSRADPAQLPAGATVWGEIRVGTDESPLGFAYVGVFAHAPAPAPTEQVYVRYEPQTERVYAERYALEFRGPFPTHVAFVDHLGEFGTNTVAGVRTVGDVRFLGGVLHLHRTDADIKVEPLGYRSGPVRVVRRGRYWVPLPLGFRTSGRVDLLFYRDFMEGISFLKVK